MKARITIMLKNGVLDPQGKAIENSLHGIGFASAAHVRQGKLIEIDLSETDKKAASAVVEQMCEKLLANTVIENYSYELIAS